MAVNSIQNTDGYSITNIASNVTAVYTGITDATFTMIRMGNIGIVRCRFKTTSNIESGYVSLSSSVPKSRAEVAGALSAIGANGGFVQYSGRTLTIRCSQAGTNFISGEVVFPIE